MKMMLLDHLYKIQPPKEAVERREQAIKQSIAAMGNKYRLAQSMPRLNKGK